MHDSREDDSRKIKEKSIASLRQNGESMHRVPVAIEGEIWKTPYPLHPPERIPDELEGEYPHKVASSWPLDWRRGGGKREWMVVGHFLGGMSRV
jgi:hypothetical protein